eukprot:1140975-Pelagomonas_calceolata.AAC.1
MLQAESASEGVRALTQSTGKRVDEHAAAIQRLTLRNQGMHAAAIQRLNLGGSLMESVCTFDSCMRSEGMKACMRLPSKI